MNKASTDNAPKLNCNEIIGSAFSFIGSFFWINLPLEIWTITTHAPEEFSTYATFKRAENYVSGHLEGKLKALRKEAVRHMYTCRYMPESVMTAAPVWSWRDSLDLGLHLSWTAFEVKLRKLRMRMRGKLWNFVSLPFFASSSTHDAASTVAPVPFLPAVHSLSSGPDHKNSNAQPFVFKIILVGIMQAIFKPQLLRSFQVKSGQARSNLIYGNLSWSHKLSSIV